MFLTRHSLHSLLGSKPYRVGSAPAFAFEYAVALRLRSLASPTAPPQQLAWVSFAADVLATTLSEAAEALSSAGNADPAAFAELAVALLDSCNAASAEVERLHRSLLFVRLGLRLLSSDANGDDARRRATAAFSEWDVLAADGSSQPPPQLPSKSSPLDDGAIYAAVEAISALVVTAATSALCGSACAGVQITQGDFAWADDFNRVAGAVASNAGVAAELQAADNAVRRLAATIDGGETGELRRAAEEAERSTEELTVALERVASAVDGVFQMALRVRKTALDGIFRVGGRTPHEAAAASR